MPHSLGKTRILIALLSIAAIGVFSRFSWDLFVDSLGPGDPRLCACDKCLLHGDPWFRALVNLSPQPFLTNYSTSKDVFNWWKRLQPEGHDFTYYNTTVANLFQMFRPVPDDVVKPRPDRCRTCAVVGNSGNLRRSRYGPLIDYHDVVIRINRGPTKGFEQDVGQKTTHHVMYPESAVNLDNTTHLVLFAFKHKDLNWLLNSFSPGALNSKRGANKNLVMILNPAFMKYVHEMWNSKNGRYPSTGFMTLILSMHMCDEISVFGFGADSDGNWDHYFEVLRNKHLKTGPHAGTHESEVIQKLHKQNKIRLFKGF